MKGPSSGREGAVGAGLGRAGLRLPVSQATVQVLSFLNLSSRRAGSRKRIALKLRLDKGPCASKLFPGPAQAAEKLRFNRPKQDSVDSGSVPGFSFRPCNEKEVLAPFHPGWSL
jgi:hypothetical protein